MARNLSVKRYTINYFDPKSKGWPATLKVVGITRQCPNIRRKGYGACVLVFTRVRCGRLVQVRYGMDDCDFFVDEIAMETAVPLDDDLAFMATKLGLTRLKLHTLIMKHAPV